MAFGSGPQLQAPPAAPSADGQPKMVTVMLFGNAHECEKAQRLIEEAVDNKEQKAKQRQKVSWTCDCRLRDVMTDCGVGIVAWTYG